jgi:hypothetical protein
MAMTNSSDFRSILGLVSTLVLLTVGCAQDKKKGSAAPPPPVIGGCPVAQVMIGGVGCVPQGNCPPNQGYYNNMCTAGTNIAVTPTNPQGFYSNQYNNGGNFAVPPTNQGYYYGANSCSVGQIYTSYGCAPTAGCPVNQGMINNACLPAFAINGNGVPNGFSNPNGYAYYNQPYYPYGYGQYSQGYNNSYYNNPYSSGYPGYSGSGSYYGYPSQNPYFQFYLNFR